MSSPTPPRTPRKGSNLPAPVSDFEVLLRRAEQGDETVVPAVRDVLTKPGAADALGGNLARQAEKSLLAVCCGTNLLFREVIARKMQELRAELAGPDSTPVERLLAERAVGCWLHLHHLETTRAAKESMEIPLALYYQRAIDRAHKRYLSALKALVEVRRLASPVLQVNIARKQVNVAGPA